MVMTTLITIAYLSYTGYEYYLLPLEERFYHPNYDWFKPAGKLGHGLGILGTLMILFGVSIYIARKRYNFMSKYIRLKYLLEFHIFLCLLGSILIVFHTSFKFGGVVSVAFWSMVAVVLSGFIGRYIYLQIPRNIEGKELGLSEVIGLRESLQNEISQSEINNLNIKSYLNEARSLKSTSFIHFIKTKKIIRKIKRKISSSSISKQNQSEVLQSIKKELALSQRIDRLQQMQKLFKYWHVAHLPFALIMLVIVLIHVIVTLALGYKWIF